jgi:carboxypeptidase PM20D1
MEKIIKNPDIKIETIDISEPTTISHLDDAFHVVKRAINMTWPEVVVAPYLMVATTDSRHYHAICERVYKFSPMDVSKADLAKIHGFDEDITIKNVVSGIQFYINLLESL